MVSSHFPPLSQPLAADLALWSFDTSIARSCSLTAVAGLLAPLLAQPFNTIRERLRDLYREVPAKAGTHRAQLELSDCWAPWLTWVLEGWQGRQLALALVVCQSCSDGLTGPHSVTSVVSRSSWSWRKDTLLG